jgi:hypothetical protein
LKEDAKLPDSKWDVLSTQWKYVIYQENKFVFVVFNALPLLNLCQ